MSLPDRQARLARLGPRRIGLLLEAAASLAVAIVQVRWGGRHLIRLLSEPAPADQAVPAAARPDLALIAWSIDAVGRRLPRDPTCLMRAVAARAMLARRGVRCCIKIGISEDSQEFRPHAWVEVGQRPLLGWLKDERFNVLAEIR